MDVVAESEGTLGVYAMLARHPHVPIGSVVLLSPIVEPGQLAQAGATVPSDLLNTLNNLVGGMSPYGSSGAGQLIESISQVGARYFNSVSHDQHVPWLAVVPLADAVAPPACPWPRNVIFVAAFHGGLLGDPSIRALTVRFFSGDGSAPADVGGSQGRLRNAAQLIAGLAPPPGGCPSSPRPARPPPRASRPRPSRPRPQQAQTQPAQTQQAQTQQAQTQQAQTQQARWQRAPRSATLTPVTRAAARLEWRRRRQ